MQVLFKNIDSLLHNQHLLKKSFTFEPPDPDLNPSLHKFNHLFSLYMYFEKFLENNDHNNIDIEDQIKLKFIV